MFRNEPGTRSNWASVVVENTHGMGIDEAGDQELPSRQMQPLELSAVTYLLQECVHVVRRYLRASWHDLLDGLYETVLADIEECVGEGFVGALVNGGDEGARDKERHIGIRKGAGTEMRESQWREARNGCRIRKG